MKTKSITEWTFLIIVYISSTQAVVQKNNEITLTTLKEGTKKNHTVNVKNCTWLEQNKITGVLESIHFNNSNNCIEIHEDVNCKGDFVIAKPGVPGIDKLYLWNLNSLRNWIDIGPRAVAPCRDKCQNIDIPEHDDIVRVEVFSKIGYDGNKENLTIKGCKVVPKRLRKRVQSIKVTSSSFCIELHELRNCSGDSIQIIKKTPHQLTRDLEYWNFNKKTLSVSLCGFNCPDAELIRELPDFKFDELHQGQLAVTLYTETDFEGTKRTLNMTGIKCLKVSGEWGTITESIQTYYDCFDVYENEKCTNGHVFRLHNSKDGRDIKLGLANGFKSVGPCFPETDKSYNYFEGAKAVVLLILVIVIIKQWKRNRSLRKTRQGYQGDPLLPTSTKDIKSEELKWPLTHGRCWPNASNFTGRKKQLKELNFYFNSNNNNLVTVSGFGGMGKTELCKKFANDIFHDNKRIVSRLISFILCRKISISRIWLNGEKLDSLRNSIKELAVKLGVKLETDKFGKVLETNKINPSKDIFNLIPMIMKNSSRVLVVIDNVDKDMDGYDEVVKIIKILKPLKKMFIVVTSRIENVLGTGITLNLDKLEIDEARQMLQKSMGYLRDSDAEELSKLVEYYPLRLQQAVAYISEQSTSWLNYTVSDYVREFNEKKREMLNQKLNPIDNGGYDMTTLVIINMTIDKLTDNALEILKIIAHLNPDRIKLKFLDKIYNERKLSHFKEHLRMLKSYFLVKIEDQFISVHRSVQEVVREKVDENYSKKLFDSVFLACHMFEAGNHYTQFELEHPSLSKFVHLKNIYEMVWKSEMHDIYVFVPELIFLLLEKERIDCGLEYIKRSFPHLQFSSLISSKKKEFFSKVILWLTVGHFNDDSVTREMIDSGEYKIDYTINIDKYEFLINTKFYINDCKLLEACMEISKNHFGLESKITLCVRIQLIRWFSYYRQIDRAIEECEKLTSFNNYDNDRQKEIYSQTIFTIMEKLEQYSGKEFLSQIVRIEEIVNHFGMVYNNTLELMELQEMLFNLQGKYKEAHGLYAKISAHYDNLERDTLMQYYDIEQRIHLTDFKSISVEEFETKYSNVFYFRFSFRGLEKILPIYEEKFGQNHLFTVRVKIEIVERLWQNEKYYDESESEKLIKFCKEILHSPIDEEYRYAYNYLCNAKKSEMKNHDKQKDFLEQLLNEKRSKLESENHRNVLMIKLLLAETIEYLGEIKEALNLFKQVNSAIESKSWSKNDLNYLKKNEARLRLTVGDFSGLKTRKDVDEKFGEFKDYKDLSFNQLKKVLCFFERILDKKDKLIHRVKIRMAWKLASTDNNKNCSKSIKSLLEQVIGSSEAQDDIIDTYDTMHDIGKRFYKKKDYKTSSELLEKVYQFRLKSLGEDHEDTIETKKYLDYSLEKLELQPEPHFPWYHFLWPNARRNYPKVKVN